MADTGEAAADAMAGTHLGMVANRAHLKVISWRRIVLLVANCLWFCITASLAFAIRFMTRKLFRAKREEDSSQHGNSNSSSTQPPEKVIVPSKSEEEEEDFAASKGREEAPVFQFRFSFQVPEENLSSREVQGSSDGEDATPYMTTSISNNYRFLSERDFRGFLEAPQAMAMCVQESFVGSDGVVLRSREELDGKLRERFSTLKCPEGADSDAGETVCGEADVNKSLHPDELELSNTEELDMELSNRFSSLKGEAGHGGATCRSLDSDGVGLENTEELDRELKTRLSSVKLPNETYSAAGAAARGNQELCSSSSGDVMDNTEKLDRELTSRFLSVKSSSSDVGAAVSNCTGGSSPGTLFKEEKPKDIEPVIQFMDEEDQLHSASLPLEAFSPAGACSLPDRSTCRFDSDASESLTDGYSVKDLNLDFDSDGFMSEKDFEPEMDKESLFELNRENEEFLACDQEPEETQLPNPDGFDAGTSMDSGGGNVESSEEMRNSKDTSIMTMHNSVTHSALRDDVLPAGEAEFDLKQEPGTPNSMSSDFNGEQDGREAKAGSSETAHPHNSKTPDGLVSSDHLEENSDERAQRREDPLKEAHSQEDSHHSEETHLSESKELSMEESDELESLWEHQDLIDQLRMELKKVRSIGLPTILEESESPKPTEDLKPWKFDAKFLHEDPMDELHKFYKSYRERMRKFDILNYQKMYAVGFLQLNDPLQSMGTHKPFIPAITTLLSRNIWPRRRKSGSEPSEKFVKELQSDLEMVYVGQSCLSWEFLRWQYERTRELLDSDLQDGRQYNQVAGEFQQFQVLIQRFLEDEPFQGPRVLNYVKNRCVIRSLLQVPVAREDCLKRKMEEKSKWEDAVTSEQLEYVIEKSIRIFWEYVKADKDDTPVIMKGLIGSHVELQDPTDRELMVDIQADLQKKEKKLKDITRSGNCLVKKFKKPRDGRCIQDDHLFSQVDLKLVSRVLKMTRITTDQLVWCHKKLSKITFVDRKLVREPSFFLFPC